MGEKCLLYVTNSVQGGSLLANKTTSGKWTKDINRHLKKEIAMTNLKRCLSSIMKLAIPF